MVLPQKEKVEMRPGVSVSGTVPDFKHKEENQLNDATEQTFNILMNTFVCPNYHIMNRDYIFRV